MCKPGALLCHTSGSIDQGGEAPPSMTGGAFTFTATLTFCRKAIVPSPTHAGAKIGGYPYIVRFKGILEKVASRSKFGLKSPWFFYRFISKTVLISATASPRVITIFGLTAVLSSIQPNTTAVITAGLAHPSY